MFSSASLLRVSRRAARTGTRTGPRIQQRGGHDHHHKDLSFLERPRITSDNFLLANTMDRSELNKATAPLKSHYAYLSNPEYRFEEDWIPQALNSKLFIKCLAEINGTEFHHKLTVETLIQAYQDQLLHFETITAPAMLKEGLSRVIVDALHPIYYARAHVAKWEVKHAIASLVFLGDKLETFRVTDNEENQWPLWKSIIPNFFLNTYLVGPPAYYAKEQTCKSLSSWDSLHSSFSFTFFIIIF